MFIIFDSDPSAVLSLRQRLYRLRVHTLCLSCEEILRVADYPVHAILIPRPEAMEDPLGFCALLREKYPTLPIAVIHRGELNYYHLQAACDLILGERTTMPKAIADLYALYREKGNPSPDSRIVDCVRTERHSRRVFIMGEPLLATHTQWMLVRYMTMVGRRAISAKELLSVGFMPGRTAASVISKKKTAAFPRTGTWAWIWLPEIIFCL